MQQLALVVDDEPVVALVTCRFLEDAGFRCLAARSAEEALKLITAGTVPDVAVLDIRLPDVPGPALALRIHEVHPQLPVLFVSAWVDGLADANSLEGLRWDFLPKPFDEGALKGAVRRLLTSRVASGRSLGLERDL